MSRAAQRIMCKHVGKDFLHLRSAVYTFLIRICAFAFIANGRRGSVSKRKSTHIRHICQVESKIIWVQCCVDFMFIPFHTHDIKTDFLFFFSFLLPLGFFFFFIPYWTSTYSVKIDQRCIFGDACFFILWSKCPEQTIAWINLDLLRRSIAVLRLFSFVWC